MTLYAHHAYGCGEKLTTAISGGYIDGTILAAGAEPLDAIQACATQLREADDDHELLVDPQFYLSAVGEANDKYLVDPGHEYYRPGRRLRDFVGPGNLTRHAKATIDFQRQFPVTRLIAPTVIFDEFDDRWYDIALNLAGAAIEYHAGLRRPPPLLVTFMFSDAALSQRRPLEQFLNDITVDGWPGCYLIPARQEDSRWPSCEGAILGRLAYIAYVLGAVNEREVVCGYADWGGLLLRAAGATAFASGWSQKYRTFRRSNFSGAGGVKRAPAKRYSSGRLLNQLKLDEARDCARLGLRNQIMSGVELDREFMGAWKNPTAQQHHWQTLHRLDAQISGDAETDLATVENWLGEAAASYMVIANEGIRLEPKSGGGHLTQWNEAITELRALAEL